MERVEAALRTQIERARKDGVTEDEVAVAKRRLRASAVYARDSLGTAPNVFGRALTSGSTVEDVESSCRPLLPPTRVRSGSAP